MTGERADLGEVRSFFAKRMAWASGSDDPRLERAFEALPREAFLGPGPWKLFVNGRYLETPSADPRYLYDNVLVALDAERRLNNGEPLLHAAWLGAVVPQRGETVCHIGAGTGYYTAILAMLVLPDGQVHGFEIEETLAARARENLEPFENASIVAGDASQTPLPACDLIYVNAGVAVPPLAWLRALRPGGRMIFPWRPSERAAVALVVRRSRRGWAVKPLMPAWFVPCIGASEAASASRVPEPDEAWSVRSLWLTGERPPDGTAVAVYDDVWFSSAPPSGAQQRQR